MSQNSVDLSKPEHAHWVSKYFFAKDKMDEYKSMMEEAKEVIQALAGKDWDLVTVNGRAVFENVKTEVNRFQGAEFKAADPEGYAKYVRKVPQSTMKPLG